MTIITTALYHCKEASPAMPVSGVRIRLMMTCKTYATATPNTPEHSPMMNVSALKTCLISFFRAPIARRMPISFVRSTTET